MKKELILAVLALMLTVTACSPKQQEKSKTTKEEDLKELFVLIKAESMVDATMEGVTNMLKQQFAKEAKDDKAKGEMDEYFEFVMQEAGKMSKALIGNEMMPIYGKYFSHEEIKDLIAFYKTPTGQKSIELQPQISKDIMQAMMTKYMPDFQAKVKAKLKELKEDKKE